MPTIKIQLLTVLAEDNLDLLGPWIHILEGPTPCLPTYPGLTPSAPADIIYWGSPGPSPTQVEVSISASVSREFIHVSSVDLLLICSEYLFRFHLNHMVSDLYLFWITTPYSIWWNYEISPLGKRNVSILADIHVQNIAYSFKVFTDLLKTIHGPQVKNLYPNSAVWGQYFIHLCVSGHSVTCGT